MTGSLMQGRRCALVIGQRVRAGSREMAAVTRGWMASLLPGDAFDLVFREVLDLDWRTQIDARRD